MCACRLPWLLPVEPTHDAGSAEVYRKVDHDYVAAAAAKAAGVPYFYLVSAQGATFSNAMHVIFSYRLAAVLLLCIFLISFQDVGSAEVFRKVDHGYVAAAAAERAAGFVFWPDHCAGRNVFLKHYA
jgi:hypothetical protein